MLTRLLQVFSRKYGEDTPRYRTACGKFAGAVGIGCNVLLFAVKLLIGILSGAVSVTADAVNNLSDAASSIVTLIGFRLSEKPADKDHPFGHARIEYLAGLVVAALILIVGYELAKSAIGKILAPSPITFSWTMAAVLAISAAVKLWMASLYRRLGDRIQSQTLLASSADSRNDVLSTLGVLLGCVAGMLTKLPLDGWIGLAVALFILYNGVGVAKETIDPLLGAAPDPTLVHHIAEKLCAYDDVLGIHDLIVHDYGPGRRFASVHVEMDRRLDVLYAHNLIDNMERDFAAENLQLVIHYDPVVLDDETVNEARRLVEDIVREIDPELHIHDFRMVEGPKHSNLIFDLVVPFRLGKDSEALRTQVDAGVRAAHPNYRTVINIDTAAFNEL